MTANVDARVLYTIRLEPSVIAKIEALAVKQKRTHAAVARDILTIATSIKMKKPAK